MNTEFFGNKKLIFILIAVFIGLVLLGNIGFRKILTRHIKLNKLEEMIKLEKIKNARLKKEINLAKTDMSYIERLARKELGLIQPGEIEYRFIKKGKEN